MKVPNSCAADHNAPFEPAGSGSRFAHVMGAREWERLKPCVRRRFSHRVGQKATTVYEGRITLMRASRIGGFIAWATRLFGGPLPCGVAAGDEATVVVHDNRDECSQTWTRVYHRACGTPQIIYSTKNFLPNGEFEEKVFGRLTLGLRISERRGDLVFNSTAYFFRVLGRRVRIPRFLSPGDLEITHEDIDGKRFFFGLVLEHPVFGELMNQRIRFEDYTHE